MNATGDPERKWPSQRNATTSPIPLHIQSGDVPVMKILFSYPSHPFSNLAGWVAIEFMEGGGKVGFVLISQIISNTLQWPRGGAQQPVGRLHLYPQQVLVNGGAEVAPEVFLEAGRVQVHVPRQLLYRIVLLRVLPHQLIQRLQLPGDGDRQCRLPFIRLLQLLEQQVQLAALQAQVPPQGLALIGMIQHLPYHQRHAAIDGRVGGQRMTGLAVLYQ